jgi:hypothetical protein
VVAQQTKALSRLMMRLTMMAWSLWVWRREVQSIWFWKRFVFWLTCQPAKDHAKIFLDLQRLTFSSSALLHHHQDTLNLRPGKKNWTTPAPISLLDTVSSGTSSSKVVIVRTRLEQSWLRWSIMTRIDKKERVARISITIMWFPKEIGRLSISLMT